jgi:asparagine synthase (glutamine-hydrolysing)
MSELVAHRGPDGEGIRLFDGPARLAVAHRRLAIIDLSSEANQPFEKDGLVIVYNGELYNYRELRAELQTAGIGFRTRSDTEVVLEAWRRHGPECLHRFRGMFAFALVDVRSGNVVLARDQFGIKPLYVTERQQGLAFASELKALRPLLGEARIDPAAIVASLFYYWVPDTHCPIAGVRKLPAGCWAEKRPGQALRVQRYFHPVAELAGHDTGIDPAELRATIERSVTAHLVADVPVATFLSGGLDSSLVTVLAQREHPNIDAYTIGFRREDQRLEAMPDDLRYARIVSQRYGIDLHEIEIAPDVADLLPKIVAALDEPIGDPAAINTFLICQAARDAGAKVLLSGMGADELFGGYRRHYACRAAARYRRLPAPLRSTMEELVSHVPVAVGGRGLRLTRWAKRFGSFASLDEEAAYRRSYTQYAPDELARLLQPELAPYVEQVVAEHAAVYGSTGFDDPVNKMCMTDVQLFLAGLNLAYTDRASMAASTEVRVPYVDVEVAAAAFRATGAQKIRGRNRKAILKQAAAEVLPRQIVDRPKALFSAPLRAWIRRDLAPMVDDLLVDGELVRGGFVHADEVTRLVQDDRAGRADRAKEIWHLLTLEEWVRQAGARQPAGAELT